VLDFPRWKVWGIVLLCLLGIAFAVPSFFPQEQTAKWPGGVPTARINLGLDLKGGSHLLLDADLADVTRQRLQVKEEEVRAELGRAKPRVEIGDISTSNGRLSFLLRNPAQADAAREALLPLTTGAGMSGQRDWNIEVRDQNLIVLTPTEAGIQTAIDQALETATDVVRRRIDPEGTKEVTVIRQGANRILVQVPGLQDPAGLKALLGQTAKLDFKLVDLTATAEQIAAGRAPVGSQILPYTEGGGGIAVKRRAMVTGDQLVNAQQAYDQDGVPVVTITFNTAGGRRFATTTRDNVGKPFAIILDDRVISAPNINEPILGGSAQIAGNFTVESANQLAVALRSGKLPVELKVIEERTVGPDLGADSIRLGAIASIVAILAVMAFMLITYGRFGLYANIALILNALLILGIMAIFNATLTLPGIAGFVLTIGAAVDANVLINERIREELRRGRKILDAVETGYKEASTAIFDANITNVIAASIMFYFGSGPIRGFAVVLMIGIVTSVFTAVNVTRMMVALWMRKARPREITI
jgi:preprotein translocase subunit SecD